MTYQKPELFLVGAAQGLVLGGNVGPKTDSESCSEPVASRSNIEC